MGQMNTLAVISGEAVVWLVIQLLIFGLVFWVLDWAVAQIGPPAPIAKVIRVVLILAIAIVLINALLNLGGHAFIVWGH